MEADILTPVRASIEEDSTLLRLRLDRPPANVIDRATIEACRAEVARAVREPRLRSILFEAEGEHFSYGASIEEHRGGEVERLLGSFHALARELLDSGKVLLAAARGRVLGGGLELVALAHRVFAAPNAQLGQPEIRLGVFAPLASVVLPIRVGQRHADDLLLTGRSVTAHEALAMGLVDEVAVDPLSAAIAWHGKHAVPVSGAALAHAVRAARHAMRREIERSLPELERLYLDELMRTEDAREGIEAFLAKRKARWRDG
jgi:cyclohexa-1,5-dienecarbonyl-CoA hydratase